MARDIPVTYAGWVYKEGSVVKNWKKRFLVVKGTELAYYKNTGQQNKAHLLGAMNIASIEKIPNIMNGLLIHSDEGRQLRIFTDTRKEFDKCFEAISEYCGAPAHDGSAHAAQAHRKADSKYVGWLNKEGQHFRTWKRRYFTLQGTTLSYSSSIGGEVLGSGRVLGTRRDNTRPLTLVVTLEGGRELRIEGKTEFDIAEWHQALRHAIQTAHQPSTGHSSHSNSQSHTSSSRSDQSRQRRSPSNPSTSRSPVQSAALPPPSPTPMEPLDLPPVALSPAGRTGHHEDDSPRGEFATKTFRCHILLESMEQDNPSFIECENEHENEQEDIEEAAADTDDDTKSFSPKAPGEDTIRRMRLDELHKRENDVVGEVPIGMDTLRRLNLQEKLLEEQEKEAKQQQKRKQKQMGSISEDPLQAGAPPSPCCCLVM